MPRRSWTPARSPNRESTFETAQSATNYEYRSLDLTATQSQTKSPAAQAGRRQDEIRFGKPAINDATGIRRLIDTCKPLDVNSTYAYLLLCHHFADTCIVARRGSDIIGFVSAYVPPRSPATLFVWQVAVHPDARGTGLGRRLLKRLLERDALGAIARLETTVSPSNSASRAMFLALARDLGAGCDERMLFDEASFGDQQHEAEVLMTLKPIHARAGN